MSMRLGLLVLAASLAAGCGDEEPSGNGSDVGPGLDARAPKADAAGQEADAGQRASKDATLPGLDAALPGLDGALAGPDSAVSPAVDAAVLGPDAAQAGPDAAQPGQDASAPPDASAPEVDAGNVPIVDIRADVNRNGTIDLDDPTEDLNEDTWDSTHGAIFLANIDDDQQTCAKSGTDLNLPKCNDASDEIVNGPDDLLDLARLKTVPWPGAPADATGTITVSAPAASYVRLFIDQGTGFAVFHPVPDKLSASQIRQGVELGIEGRDIVRNTAVWDGYVDITFTVTGSGFSAQSDKVRMREAPMITRHHLDPPLRLYAVSFSGDSDSAAFIGDLEAAMSASGVANPLWELNTDDQWAQDYFETAYMSMPGPNGLQVIHVNVRSANQNRNGVATNYPLREAGQVVFTELRGKDVGGVQQYTSHGSDMDTLDSFGNLETIPPYSLNGVSYPLGRIFRGNVPSWHPDTSVLTRIRTAIAVRKSVVV